MTLVVKFGGGEGLDAEALCADVAGLTAAGTPVVVVHGGSAEMAGLADRLGVRLRTLTAPDGVTTRYTDAATLDVLLLALAGRVKPALLTLLARHGVRAMGLTGLDGGLLRARRKRAVRAVVDGRTVVVRDDHSGRIASVNSGLLRSLLAMGIVPVVSPPALAEDGEPVNANADRVAAAVAVALRADRLVFVTGAPGVLADPGDESSVMAECRPPVAGAGGGMAIKLVAAQEALDGGVGEVRVCGGGRKWPVSAALRGEAGTRVFPASAQ